MEEVKCRVCEFIVPERKAVFDNLGKATCLDCERESEEHAYDHEGEE